MKTKKRILPLLLIMFLLLSNIPFLSIQVSASDWEECVYCGHNRSADWLCDCGGCNENSYDCYSEHHCYDCGACEMDISMCDDCKRCVDCVGIMCMDCGQCEECAGRICDDCQKCSDHWTLDLYCEGCDKCCDCFGLGYCFECELCGDCTNLCSNDDCSLCETCTGQVCTECGQCALCAYGLFCEYCGSCGECSGLMCPHCTLCDDCVTVCKGCENGCSDCRDICMTCEECEDCVETLCPECNECIGCSGATICIGCDLCSNCVNMCEDCGEVCSDCEDFCQECNICTNCLPEELCNGCGDYCLGCKEYCTECSCCEECADICKDCGEVCTNCGDLCSDCGEYCSDCRKTCEHCGTCEECANICEDCGVVCDDCANFCSSCNECENCGEWMVISLNDRFHQFQCSCGHPFEESESHLFIYHVVKAATATEMGFGKLICQYCNYEETITIPATGGEEHTHNFSLWVSNLTFHEMYCACGEKNPSTKGDHEFQWVTDIEATIGATGLKHQECAVCGYQLPEEIIPPITTYEVTVTNGTGGGNYAAGATVNITANAPATGKVFDKWTTSDGVTFGDENTATTTFVMPAKAVTVTATYKDAPVTTYAVTVNSGTGGGNYAAGATVNITANAPATGKVFDKWTTSDGVTFANENTATTTFVMPAKAVTVTATYKDAPVTTYAVTVTGGTGSGNFAAGATVSITANAAETGKVFDKWTTTDGVAFANSSSANTTFVMPAKAVTVTATYKNNPEPVVPDPTDPEKPVDPDPEKFSYKIIKGANGKWDKTSKAGLEFISNGDFDKFEEVKVDGKTIDKKHYSAKAGSTIVTLKDSLLSTLGKGDHSLTLVFEDGKVETKFTILEKETLPKTGDAVYPTMLFGFILLLAGVFMYRRREA